MAEYGEVEVCEKILIKIMCNGAEQEASSNIVQPRWDMQENVLYEYLESSTYQTNLKRTSTQSLAKENSQNVSAGLQKIEFNNVGVGIEAYIYIDDDVGTELTYYASANHYCGYVLLTVDKDMSIRMWDSW